MTNDHLLFDNLRKISFAVKAGFYKIDSCVQTSNIKFVGIRPGFVQNKLSDFIENSYVLKTFILKSIKTYEIYSRSRVRIEGQGVEIKNTITKGIQRDEKYLC